MRIEGAKFLTSSAGEGRFPDFGKPLLAICGKSNAGKSTLINFLAGQKGLAKTSSTPGRTRLVNYFDFGAFVLADLPGYGYAAVSKEEKAKWGRILDKFFEKKEKISHVLLLSDIRRDPSDDDLKMAAYLNYHIIPFTVIATKCDKLSRMKAKERVRAVANGFGLGADNVLAVSALSGEGKEALLSLLGTVVARSDARE